MCLVVTGYLVFQRRGFLIEEDIPVVRQLMEFAAPLLRKLYQLWIEDNKDSTSVFAALEMSVGEMLRLQCEGDDVDNVIASYNDFGGEVELHILCHLCPGLRVQVEQMQKQKDMKKEKATHTMCANENPASHTIFLKREDAHSETRCHYNLLFWDVCEGEHQKPKARGSTTRAKKTQQAKQKTSPKAIPTDLF